MNADRCYDVAVIGAGGAGQMAATVRAIRQRCPGTGVEVLIADYKGDQAALRCVLEAEPDVLNHNLETVERLQRRVRPAARYERTPALIRGPAPKLGEHTCDVLTEIGYGAEEIDALRSAGIIGGES